MFTHLVDIHAARTGKYMPNEEARSFWTYVQVVLLVCTLSIGLSWYSLWEHYVATRPRSKDAQVGRVIPLVSHGIVVYLTQEEQRKLKVLDSVGTGVGLTFVLFSVWKQFIRRQP